jgi:hypothetical protein
MSHPLNDDRFLDQIKQYAPIADAQPVCWLMIDKPLHVTGEIVLHGFELFKNSPCNLRR